MTDRVNAVMDTVQLAGGDAPRDSAIGQSERPELPSRDKAVLAVGEFGDEAIGMGWLAIWPHTDHFSDHVRHDPSIAEQMSQRTPPTHQSTANAVL